MYHTKDQLLDYARLQHNCHIPWKPIPEPWEKIDKKVIGTAGFFSKIYRHKETGQIVVAISGQRPHRPLFLADMLIRRRWLSKYSKRIAEWSETFMYKHFNVTFIGSSGGGGVAVWLGALHDRPSVSFNGGRTEYSLLNDGTKCDIIYVRGDGWGDPYNGNYGMPMRGHELVLEPIEGKSTHHMSTIIEILENES